MGPNMTHLLDSLGWALLHSLWQGGLAFIAVVLIRVILKNSTPNFRYIAQFSVLLACFAAFLATFGLYLKAGLPMSGEATFQSGGALAVDYTPMPLIATVSGGLSTVHTNFLQNISGIIPVLAIFWCLGFSIMALRYLGAFMLTQRLRRYGLTEPSILWRNRFRTLVLNAGLSANIRLHISEYVSGPVALGFFKPVVLVPIGFLTGLPQDQVEAILLHEIAHIRRYDYIMNLIQIAIKTVFFFHPAIHYISRKIDIDREQACDDLAVAQGRNPRALAKGLAALRLQSCQHGLALNAAGDNKGEHAPLLDRLTRLAGQAESPRRSEHMIMSALTAVLIGSVYITTTATANAHPKNTSKVASPADIAAENFKFKSTRINGHDVVLKISEDGRRWINVDNKWHDVDENPSIVNRVQHDYPVVPLAPRFDNLDLAGGLDQKNFDKLISKEANRWAQFNVDVAYFERSLENLAEKGRMTDSLIEHYEDKADRLMDKAEARFERRLDQIESMFERQIEADMRKKEAKEHQLEVKQRQAEAQQPQIDARQRQLELQREGMQRVEDSKVRAQEQRNRARELAHETKTHAKYNELRSKLYAQLLDDGMIKSTRSKVTMRYENETWTANGKAVPFQTENKYCGIFSDMGINKSHLTKIDIRPNSTHIMTRSQDGKKTHNITHGQFNHSYNKTHLDYAKAEDPIPPVAPVPPIVPAAPELPAPTFIVPTPSPKITARYGMKASIWPQAHQGIDLKADKGAPVYASTDGIVSLTTTHPSWGNRITLKHNNGYQTLYGHLNSFNVKTGETVKAGQVIGTVGSTGRSTGPHLHFEIRKDGQTINPESYIF